MSEPVVTVLARGVSRRFEANGDPLRPGKKRGRSKKGQGANGGRKHDWTRTSSRGLSAPGELFVERGNRSTERKRAPRDGTGRPRPF